MLFSSREHQLSEVKSRRSCLFGYDMRNKKAVARVVCSKKSTSVVALTSDVCLQALRRPARSGALSDEHAGTARRRLTTHHPQTHRDAHTDMTRTRPSAPSRVGGAAPSLAEGGGHGSPPSTATGRVSSAAAAAAAAAASARSGRLVSRARVRAEAPPPAAAHGGSRAFRASSVRVGRHRQRPRGLAGEFVCVVIVDG